MTTSVLRDARQLHFTRTGTCPSTARVRIAHFPACLPNRHATLHTNACSMERKYFEDHIVKVEKDCSGNCTCILSRRNLVATVLAFATGLADKDAVADASTIDILEDYTGIGSHGARRGDLLLFHYVGGF
ncbi:hypothetical protein Vafri_11997 [Volvox africanus]|uniref:Uncharacterized protein n=1 Tax=Volvox africanus TaxID=51714 RepID=A0A8J4B9C8_9CHLO|nr:hypothetical protein Vafri_11997 [Volvox africanus]